MKTLTLKARHGLDGATSATRRGHTASSTTPPAILLPFSHFFRRENLAVPNFGRTFAAVPTTAMLSAGHRSMLRISRVCNMARTVAGYIPSLSHIRLSSRYLIVALLDKVTVSRNQRVGSRFFMSASVPTNRMKTLTLTARTGYAPRRGHTVLFSAHIVSRLSGAVGCVAAAAVWFMALAMPADASVAYRTAIAVAAVVALVGLMTAAVTPDRKGGAR